MISPMRWFSLRLAISAFLLACGDGAGPGADRVCSAPLQVYASHSVTPTVSWAEGCRVNQVVISTSGPLVSLVRMVFCPNNANLLVPPLEYDVVPDGLQQLPEHPEPLEPGVSYTIDVFISDSTQANPIVRIGTTTIVP